MSPDADSTDAPLLLPTRPSPPCKLQVLMMPAQRRAELEATVLRYFQATELTADVMAMAEVVETKRQNLEW